MPTRKRGLYVSQTPLAWELTIALIVGLLLFDYFFHIRKAHVPTLAEAARWSAAYVGIALLFGAAVLALGGSQMGTEYFAGYITEKALSIDNVFVFLVIMAAFRVPREDQQKALLVGIVFSLIARAGFIFLGAAMIGRFAWVFYIFGLILLLTAGHLLSPTDKGYEDDEEESFIVRMTRRLVPTTSFYDGDKFFTMHEGKRRVTPMVLVVIALGATDVLFALDSIPAIFGLTQNVFIVFTATAFSLLGLRQLYFLIDGLLERLLYLSYGLAAILGFIGIKLILHALHENDLPFINGGMPVNVVEVTTLSSLFAIVGILALTVLLSLLSPKGKAKTAVARLRSRLAEWRDLDVAATAEQQHDAYSKLLDAERVVKALPEEYRALINERKTLREMLSEAHRQQATAASAIAVQASS